MISLSALCLKEQNFSPVVYYYYDRADMPKTTPRETTQTHSLHEIMYVTEGSAVITADRTTITLGPRQYIWLDAMTHHSLIMPEEAPLSMMNIEYQFEIIPRCCPTTREMVAASPAFSRMLSCGAPFQVLSDTFGAVFHLLKQINQLAGSGWKDADKLCSSLAMQLLVIMAQSLPPEQNTDNTACPPELDAVLRIMESRFSEPLTASQIAEEIGVSPALLRHMFRKHTGGTMITNLQNIRVMRAKELLLSTPDSIQEIAYAVGIESRKYFVQLFTQSIGISPVEYRQRYKLSCKQDMI